MPDQHHPTLPPSSLDKKKHCPCWQSGDVGQAAVDGTEDHAALAQSLGSDKPAPVIPAGRQAEVLWASDLIKCQADAATLRIEEPVQVYDADFNVVTWGTADALDSATLWDYKSGQPGDYEAQMACYALALMQLFDTRQARVVILYGRRQRADEYYLTRSQAEEIVWPLLARIRDGQAARETHVGPWCGWCALRATCEKFTAALPVARRVIAGDLPEFDPARLDDPAELAKALRFVRLFLNPWSDAIEKRAKAAALDGKHLPGFELITKQGRRQIEDLAQAFQLLALPQETFLACCTLALGKTEAVFSEHNTLTRARAKAEVSRRLEPITVRGEPTTELVATEETETTKGAN